MKIGFVIGYKRPIIQRDMNLKNSSADNMRVTFRARIDRVG